MLEHTHRPADAEGGDGATALEQRHLVRVRVRVRVMARVRVWVGARVRVRVRVGVRATGRAAW